MSERLLEEYLEGTRRFHEEVPADSSGRERTRVQGALFERALSQEELLAVEDLMTIGKGVA